MHDTQQWLVRTQLRHQETGVFTQQDEPGTREYQIKLTKPCSPVIHPPIPVGSKMKPEAAHTEDGERFGEEENKGIPNR